jgi:hypothetical protein
MIHSAIPESSVLRDIGSFRHADLFLVFAFRVLGWESGR